MINDPIVIGPPFDFEAIEPSQSDLDFVEMVDRQRVMIELVTAACCIPPMILDSAEGL